MTDYKQNIDNARQLERREAFVNGALIGAAGTILASIVLTAIIPGV